MSAFLKRTFAGNNRKKFVSTLGLIALLTLLSATFAPRATAAPTKSPDVIAAVFYAD